MVVVPWKKIREDVVFDSYRKIVKKLFLMPDGVERNFEIAIRNDAVGIFAITDDNEVLLTHLFRPGYEQVVKQLPAGDVDPGEDKLEAAKRELLEETGYTGDFEYIASFPMDSYSNKFRHAFLVRNCRKIQEQRLEEREFIDVVKVPIKSYIEGLIYGKYHDEGYSVFVLLHLNKGLFLNM